MTPANIIIFKAYNVFMRFSRNRLQISHPSGNRLPYRQIRLNIKECDRPEFIVKNNDASQT